MVLICTCTGVVSGKASRSRWRIDTMPPATILFGLLGMVLLWVGSRKEKPV